MAVPEFNPWVFVIVQDSGVAVAVKNPAEVIVLAHPELSDHVPPKGDAVNCCVPSVGMDAATGDIVTEVGASFNTWNAYPETSGPEPYEESNPHRMPSREQVTWGSSLNEFWLA